MKVKSLLLAAAAFVAMNAGAFTITMPSIEVNAENVGQVIDVPITLADYDNYTNIQFHVVFPKGVKPVSVMIDNPDFDPEEEESEDNPKQVEEWVKSGNSRVSFSANFNVEENWPDYDIIGANMQKKKVTKNPIDVCTFHVVCDSEAEGQFKLYMKGTKEDDTPFEYGESDGTNYTCLAPNEGGDIVNTLTAVEDVNAAKTVASVKYMNAAGMVSDTAFQGVNIVVTKYADGTQSTAKVVK